jgi:hypothetical protein
MYPVIVCIAKKEHDYIEEFVRYHLALGFKHIYLYDNEDTPIYAHMLKSYGAWLTVIHLPHNNYHKGVQYMALDHFIKHYINRKPRTKKENKITHVAHIDIDEFISLKKHSNICDFIKEYIVGDCQGIGMNWRFFGSSGRTEKTAEPVTQRFTMCQSLGDQHIKTLFKVDNFINWEDCHHVILKYGSIKSTNGKIIKGPFNPDIDNSVIQLNHYKCKTLPEFRYIRTRQRADLAMQIPEDVDANFKLCDINDVEDLTACEFYKKISK